MSQLNSHDTVSNNDDDTDEYLTKSLLIIRDRSQAKNVKPIEFDNIQSLSSWKTVLDTIKRLWTPKLICLWIVDDHKFMFQFASIFVAFLIQT